MKKEKIEQIIQDWKTKNKKRMYTPFKYFEGLTSKVFIIKRLEEMNNNKQTKTEYKTDNVKNRNRKRSNYHNLFEKKYKLSITSTLEEKATVTGVPLSILKSV